jgi:hypothetical protein
MIFGYITAILHRKLNTVAYFLKARAVKPPHTASQTSIFPWKQFDRTVMGSSVLYVVHAKLS